MTRTDDRSAQQCAVVAADPQRNSRPCVDVRTRNTGAMEKIDPQVFWQTDWLQGLRKNGERAAADARRLGLVPLVIGVDDQEWTLRLGEKGIEVISGREATPLISMDSSAFADLVGDRKTALGLAIAGRIQGDGVANALFCAWDPVLRSVLDGRSVYQPGEVTLRALDGSSLDLGQAFRPGERTEEAAHFLAEAGFLLLKGVITAAELAELDRDHARAVAAAAPDDGESWWASTRDGAQYPCRILNFTSKSTLLSKLLSGPRFRAIGEILGDGHVPGDPFGEHFSDASAEALMKRVGSVEGLSCLPWHKDCERGGHSMFCSGLTVGICLTPIDDAHGGLDVLAGSHRANVARAQVEQGLDLPTVSLKAERGDLTVHASCVLHCSTHPASAERRVIYTGFSLPGRPGDHAQTSDRSELERERADIGERKNSAPLAAGFKDGEDTII